MSSRLPVAGTIARSEPIQVGNELGLSLAGLAGQHRPRHRHHQLRGDQSAAGDRRTAPARPSSVFNINCAACHSKLGDGNGIPKRIGAMAVVANLHDKRIVELTDGELFNTVSYGKNLMQATPRPSPIQDRWAAIAYLRALQLSQLGTLDEVPEALRGTLK